VFIGYFSEDIFLLLALWNNVIVATYSIITSFITFNELEFRTLPSLALLLSLK